MENDTICAISTAPGIGGIAVIRVSGAGAFETVQKIWRGKPIEGMDSHTAHLGAVNDADGERLDQVVLTVFRSPNSFTGEDVAEISVHGSRFVQRELLVSLTKAGARIAEPGEFTRRAFTAGKMDLAEAEAIADVIASNSRAAHRIAMNQMRGGFSRRLAQLREQLVELASLLELELDFSEEDVEFASRTRLRDIAVEIHTEITRLRKSFNAGNAIKEGIPVAIVGPTNAGKSSLLNTILDEERAIVSDVHGTTRDTIEETIEIGDYQFRFIDTAGLRDTADVIEQIGIQRSRQAIDKARIVIVMLDATSTVDFEVVNSAIEKAADETSPTHVIIAFNKTDITLPDETIVEQIRKQINQSPVAERITCLNISARTGQGIEQLKMALTDAARVDNGNADEDILVTNARHAEALSNAATSISRVLTSLDSSLSGDLIAQDLRETISHLASITGEIPSNEILANIFSRFCIGK